MQDTSRWPPVAAALPVGEVATTATGASGTRVDMAELKQLATGVDLARAEALLGPRK